MAKAGSTEKVVGRFGGRPGGGFRPKRRFGSCWRFTSTSCRIVTICSSVNRVFFMAPPGPEDAILSSVSWSEKRQAGQPRLLPTHAFSLCCGDASVKRGAHMKPVMSFIRGQTASQDSAGQPLAVLCQT